MWRGWVVHYFCRDRDGCFQADVTCFNPLRILLKHTEALGVGGRRRRPANAGRGAQLLTQPTGGKDLGYYRLTLIASRRRLLLCAVLGARQVAILGEKSGLIVNIF